MWRRGRDRGQGWARLGHHLCSTIGPYLDLTRAKGQWSRIKGSGPQLAHLAMHSEPFAPHIEGSQAAHRPVPATGASQHHPRSAHPEASMAHQGRPEGQGWYLGCVYCSG